MTYRETLHEAIKTLEDLGVYADSAQVLLLELTREKGIDLYRDYEEEMDEEIRKSFLDGLEHLKKDEPLGYILGYTWFYGRKIKVNSDVLIPRPETEELCAHVLGAIDEYFPEGEVECVDIGTGSGEIGITISLEEPRVKMHASDISEEALVVAKENAKRLEADIDYDCGDMLEPWIKKGLKVDVLISDPPYIPVNQEIDFSVKEYEPHVALFGGEDGLFFYRSLLKNAHKVIKDKAIIAFEIGYDQKEAILDLADEAFPDEEKEVLQDLAGKDRILMIYVGLGK